MSSTVCPMTVNTSQYTICQPSVNTSQRTISWFCVTVKTDASYSSPMSVSASHSTVCWFCVTASTLVFNSLSNVCHYLTEYYTWLCQCPLLSSIVCPISAGTSRSTITWFCVIVCTAVFYSLSNVSQYLTLYHLLPLSHYVHCCFL